MKGTQTLKLRGENNGVVIRTRVLTGEKDRLASLIAGAEYRPKIQVTGPDMVPQSASGFGEHVDYFVGHRVYDQNLTLEFEIGIVFEGRHFVDQRRRQRMRFQSRRYRAPAPGSKFCAGLVVLS